MPLPEFDSLYSVSDLHLGGGPGPELQIFNRGNLLARTIDLLTVRPAAERVALVLNGDIVDFLAEEDAKVFDPDKASEKLGRIMGDPSFSMVFEALGRFVRTPRRTLVLVIGNHDVELALPGPRDLLVDFLCQGDDAARGRLHLALDGVGWSATVGGARVLCLHGNEADPWNVVDHEALRRAAAQAARGERITAAHDNAGSRLVVNAMNDIKRDYPFVDLLKPETSAAVNILPWIDPGSLRKVWSVVDALSRVPLPESLTRASPAGIEGAHLSEEAMYAALMRSSQTGPGLVDAQRAAAGGTRGGGEAWDDSDALGRGAAVLRPSGHASLLWATLTGMAPAERFRRALSDWLRLDASFAHAAEDEIFKVLDPRVGPEVAFLLAGHTHLARAIERSTGGGYFNSGTWIRLIELTPDDLAPSPGGGVSPRFQAIYDALTAGTMAALDRGVATTRGTVTCLRAESGGGAVGELMTATEQGDSVALVAQPGTRIRAPGR